MYVLHLKKTIQTIFWICSRLSPSARIMVFKSTAFLRDMFNSKICSITCGALGDADMIGMTRIFRWSARPLPIKTFPCLTIIRLIPLSFLSLSNLESRVKRGTGKKRDVYDFMLFFENFNFLLKSQTSPFYIKS